jgi:uncharacterized protein YdhG (YjbR/CyaY superfamily)
MPATNKPAPSTASKVFTAEEKAAMKELIKERRASRSNAEAEADCLAKIAEMPKPDRVMAERIHAIVKANAPTLTPKAWYGMPAYAKDGKVICFFQSGAKFKSRYATFGFQQDANLDDGDIWPTSFAVNRLTAAVEDEIGKVVKKAAG